MVINTRYNIGDKVWVEFFMRPTRMIVESIEFRKDENTESIWYFVVNINDRRECYDANESELFPTKEELIKSMSRNPNAEMQDGLSDVIAELSLLWMRNLS